MTLPEIDLDPDAVPEPRRIFLHVTGFGLAVLAVLVAAWYFVSPATFPLTASHTTAAAQSAPEKAKDAWDGLNTDQQQQICDLYDDDSMLAMDVVKKRVGATDPAVVSALSGLLDRTC